MDIPEATYHYQMKIMKQANSNEKWETLILETFKKHEGRYGYRRIHAELRAQGYTINHKKIQRIMKKLGLKCVKFVRNPAINPTKERLGKSLKTF